MFKIEWDIETGGILLSSKVTKETLGISPRPVMAALLCTPHMDMTIIPEGIYCCFILDFPKRSCEVLSGQEQSANKRFS